MIEAMDAQRFLNGGGAMSVAIRDYDWGSTPLGRIDDWPASLKISVGLVLSSRFPKCIAWGPHLISIYNDAFRPILGDKPETLGRPFNEIWSEVWDSVGPIAEKAFAGEATFIEDLPLTINRFGYPEQTYFTFCYSPIRDETGQVRGMMDTVIETTGKIVAERNVRLLNAELSHRIKNMLTMISAVAHQTFRAAPTKKMAETTLDQRIAALGHAHDLLTRSNSHSAPVQEVIEGALVSHRSGGGQFSIAGPPVDLAAKQSLSLALAINELATNALKYGSLSSEKGRVDISWQIGAPGTDEMFRLVWQERNGPTVSPPERRGFGSRLIEHVLAEDFSGKARIAYDPEGLKFELTTKMKNLHHEHPDTLFG